jgi:uncharacterized protein (DUF305 family)
MKMDVVKDNHAAHDSAVGDKPMSHNKNYRKLLIMMVLSFISMYILMYAMVNTISNVFNHLNQVYMAGLMAAPMVVIELTLMGMMYPNKKRNALLMAGSVIAMLVFFLFIRQQTAISNTQFLRSMIPHHSSAILMCERASITDPEIEQLCQEIVSSQQEEIDQMRAILDRIDE